MRQRWYRVVQLPFFVSAAILAAMTRASGKAASSL